MYFTTNFYLLLFQTYWWCGAFSRFPIRCDH